jgi:hypothetical protein
MMRRLVVGLTVMFGLSVWAWCRADGKEAEARPAEPTTVTEADDEGGNQGQAAYRYRTSQASHWRHVMIGGH